MFEKKKKKKGLSSNVEERGKGQNKKGEEGNHENCQITHEPWSYHGQTEAVIHQKLLSVFEFLSLQSGW